MKRFHKVRTPVKTFTLQMKIGVASGECLLAGWAIRQSGASMRSRVSR